MAYSAVPTRVDGVDANSAADINQLQDNDDYLKAEIESNDAEIAVLQAGGTLNIKSVAANYTILDDDGYGIFEFDCSTGDKDLTLPTLADNQGRLIRVNYGTNGGTGTIDGEGAETIQGDAEIYLMSPGDYALIYGSSSEWKLLGLKTTWKSGMINRSDWTNVHMGSVEIDYDNLSGAFTVGEVVSGGTSLASGIITADNGSTLKIKEMSEGGGGDGFDDGETLTGATSGATADVNEGSGHTINKDTNCFHNIGKDIIDLDYRFIISTDGTYNNSFSTGQSISAPANVYGVNIFQIDTNNLKFQTGSNGMIEMSDAGAAGAINTDDYYYEIIVQRII